MFILITRFFFHFSLTKQKFIHILIFNDEINFFEKMKDKQSYLKPYQRKQYNNID